MASRLITLDDSGVIRIWMLDREELLEEACMRTMRNLTYAEWVQYMGADKPYSKTCQRLPVHASYIQAVRDLVKSGQIDQARAEFERIGTMAPELNIDVDQIFRDIGTEVFFEGRQLAEAGDIEEAVTKFKLAKILDERFDNDPYPEARSALQEALIEKAEKLLKEGEYSSSLAAFVEADALETGWRIASKQWNEVCWQGSIHRRAASVLDACERAVATASDEERFYFRDSRGVARVLTKDYAGAIEDFEAFLGWAGGQKSSKPLNEAIRLRKSWITTLKTENDPFRDIDLRTVQ